MLHLIDNWYFKLSQC